MNAVDDAGIAQADVPPVVIRGALNLLRKRGVSATRVCKGLGFVPEDLMEPDIRVSYRQTSLLVRRAQQALGDPAMGLAVGAAQTPVSWGLAGLGMLTCRTLAEAVEFGAQHQIEAGALLLHKTYFDEGAFVLEVTPRFFDPELEPYLVEDAFASVVTVMRSLVGPHYKPMAVELAYPKPGHAAAYKTLFDCKLRFESASNRLLSDPAWLERELSTYDHYTSDSLRARLVSLMAVRDERKELLESVRNYLRTHVDEPQAIEGLAKHLNLGIRTLRRRLAEMNVSYRELFDRARYERSLELLQRTAMSVNEIALATGFGDASNFRRAFKRWSGVLPSDVRQRGARRAAKVR